MIKNNEIEHVLAYNNSNYACNQGSIIKLNNDELFLGYNQERGLIHADSGQSCFIKSNDDGKTWDVNTNKVIWPFNEYQGNWDCAFSQISDGSILMHTRVCSFIKSSALKVNSPQSFGGTTPDKSERLKRQTGYSLLKSYDLGVTWDEPIPVNTSPISESGFAAYSVGGSGAGHIIELSDGGLLMPLHGSITKEFVAQGGEQARTFVLRSDDKGNNWDFIDISDISPIGYTRNLVLDPNDINTLYVSLGKAARSRHGGLIRSKDLGRTWCRIDGGIAATSTMMSLTINQQFPDNIYCATRDGQVFGTENGGTEWHNFHLPEGVKEVRAIVCTQ